MIISSKALEAIRSNKKLKTLLALNNDRSESTIQRWLDSEDPMLTTADNLKTIREETGLTDAEILTEQPVQK